MRIPHTSKAFFISALLFLFTCSCSPVTRSLNDIESYIQERPDSALSALESIKRDNFASKKQRAKFALLYAMALDKNYIDTTEAMIVAPAVDYYRNHGRVEDRFKALYYEGRIYANAADHNRAIVSYTEALPLLDQMTDYKYCGMLCYAIAREFNNTYCAQDALEYIQKSCDYYRRGNFDSFLTDALYAEAQDYTNLGMAREAFSVLDTLRLSNVADSYKAEFNSLEAFIHVMSPSGDYKKANDLFESVLNTNGTFPQISHWGAYAYSLYETGREKESEDILRYLDSMDDFQAKSVFYKWDSLINEESHSYKTALEEYKQLFTIQNESLRKSLSQTTIKAQRDYYDLRGQRIAETATKQNLVYSIIILCCIIALFFVLIIYRAEKEKANKEINKLAELSETVKLQLIESENARLMESFDNKKLQKETEELKGLISQNDEVLRGLRAEYSHMYKEKFSLLGDLCETYFRYSGSAESYRHIYEKVSELLSDITGDKAGQIRFEKMINANLDNIMKHFRSDFPQYSEADYRFISYVFIGFDATTLLVIFNMPSQGSVYAKKNRIKSVINRSDSIYKETYLEMMS